MKDQDQETLNLCMQVAFATGWDDKALRHFDDEFPLYTSDYLLEKLPRELTRYGRFELVPTMRNTRWSTGYWTTNRLDTFSVVSDSPLKALLKLTLALRKEGLLS
jgi:hypothetical protein